MGERTDTRGLHAGINIKILIVRYYPRPVERKPDFSSGCQPAKTHGRRHPTRPGSSSLRRTLNRARSNDRENRVARPRPRPNGAPLIILLISPITRIRGVFVTRVARTINLCPCLESKYDGNRRVAPHGERTSHRYREKNFEFFKLSVA